MANMTLRRIRNVGLSVLATAAVGSLPFGHVALAAPLTPDEALQRAIKRSPDLRAALAELESARFGVLGQDRARDWVLRASLQGQYSEQFSDTGQGAILNSNQNIAGEVSVTTTTDIGTVIKVGLGTSSRWQRINQDVGTANEIVLGPSISADLSLDITQPLLRGGGTDAVLAGLRQAKLSERIAQVARDEGASQIALDTMTTYWNLWLAEQALNVERASLAVTQKQLADMKTKLALGTVPQTDVLRLASQEAAARQSLVAAESQLADRQFALARRVGIPLSEAATLTASGQPSALGQTGSLEVLVQVASESSYALLQLQEQLVQAKDRVRVAADAVQPRLDLWASIGAGGLWTEDDPAGLALPGGRPAFVALVGLDFELPLGDSAAEAQYSQTRAELRAAEYRFQSRSEILAEDIATQYRSLETAMLAAKSASETAAIAAQLAEKEGQRLRLGTALVSEVISAQQSLREAELSRLRAETDVALAALQLDHQTGQLLTRLALTIPTSQTTEDK